MFAWIKRLFCKQAVSETSSLRLFIRAEIRAGFLKERTITLYDYSGKNAQNCG